MATKPTAARAARSTSSQTIPTGNLNSRDFAPFGQVIQNPARGNNARLEKVIANQGTATKWLDVTSLTNWYHLAPSKKPAKSVVNMFVCKPRELRDDGGRQMFDVKILERHPFTPQTFIPLGVAAEDEDSSYLVIVAPTLKTTNRDSSDDRTKPYPAEKPKPKGKSLRERLLGARPNPYTNDHDATTTPTDLSSLGTEVKPKGPGEPDLDHLQAFIARGDQAVTYGPGTWHAPMVALGKKDIDFVVVQYANGVGIEDCQECDVQYDIAVDVDRDGAAASGPGIMRAKL